MDHLKTLWAQLWQWPPTSSTAMGGSALLGLVLYAVTGSWEAAGFLSTALTVICPQDAPAIKAGLDEARKITTAPVA